MSKKRNQNPPTDKINKMTDTSEAKKMVLSIKLKLTILLGVIAFIVYANTLNNGFVLDDVEVMTGNVIVQKGFSGIPELMVSPRLKGYMNTTNENYRPLPLVISALEYQMFGPQPAECHFLNIVFFIGCVLVFFFFLNLFFYFVPSLLIFFDVFFFFRSHNILCIYL